MKITVELPEDVMQRPDPGHEALQALALAGYRSGVLTHYQASRLLGMSRLEFDALLKSLQVDEHVYDVADLEEDLATLEGLEATGRMPRL
jgi:predicted HTH domain antitoxin